MPAMLPIRLLPRALEKAAAYGVVETRASLSELAQQIERKAKDNASTGHHAPHGSHIPGTGPGPNTATLKLKRGITHTRVKEITPAVFQTTVGVSDMVQDYPELVEFGGTGNGGLGPPYPYLIPAIEWGHHVAPEIWRRHMAYIRVIEEV